MEKWKVIKGTNERYKVSTLGRVLNTKSGRRIGYVGSDKYVHVMMHRWGVLKNIRVHTLVWEVFGKGKSNRVMVIDHVNNVKHDNRLENLQLIPFRENVHKDTKTETGIVGVHYNRIKKHYRSTIMLDGVRYNLGARKCLKEATGLYDEAIERWEEQGLTPNDVKEVIPKSKKKCTGCNIILDLNNFGEYKTSNGYISNRSKCKPCYKEYRKYHDAKYRNKLKTKL